MAADAHDTLHITPVETSKAQEDGCTATSVGSEGSPGLLTARTPQGARNTPIRGEHLRPLSDVDVVHSVDDLQDRDCSAAVDLEVFVRARKPNEEVAAVKNAALRRYLRNQNAIIDRMVCRAQARGRAQLIGTAVRSLVGDVGAERAHGDRSSGASCAMRVSLAANVVLLIIKLFAAIWSGSLSVVGSAIDSFLDLLSGTLLLYTAWAATRGDSYRYPVGRTRLEPVGVVVFSTLMALASILLAKEGVEDILAGFRDEPPELQLDAVTWVVLSATIIAKAVLFFYCRLYQGVSASVEALAVDHRNDCITNSAAVLAVALTLVDSEAWPADPLGAIVLAFYLLWTWGRTGYKQVKMLTGESASPEVLSEITRIALEHSDRVDGIDTVRAYHIGTRLLVEVHLLLPADMTLSRSHDIGEELQLDLESLQEVERCFTHLDFEVQSPACEHVPTHLPGDSL